MRGCGHIGIAFLERRRITKRIIRTSEHFTLLNWIKKLLNGSTSSSTKVEVQSPTQHELLDEFRAYISREIASGYASPDEALETAIDVMSDDVDVGILRSTGPEILSEELAAQLKKQEKWPEITDCDRLDSVFNALEEKGIVSRQNFSCCGTCGAAEIWDEIEASQNAGKTVRGYTFFHMQDTESAVEGGGLYLNYGSSDAEEGEGACVSIGNEIQRELEAHDLKTSWDGTLSTRISVSLDWKRKIKLHPREQFN